METTKRNETAALIAELMAKFDENRARWIKEFGTDAGFNEWFTARVMGR